MHYSLEVEPILHNGLLLSFCHTTYATNFQCQWNSNFTKHHTGSLQKHSKFVFSWNLVQYIGQAKRLWQSLFTCIDFIRLHWTQKCKKKNLSPLSLCLSLSNQNIRNWFLYAQPTIKQREHDEVQKPESTCLPS